MAVVDLDLMCRSDCTAAAARAWPGRTGQSGTVRVCPAPRSFGLLFAMRRAAALVLCCWVQGADTYTYDTVQKWQAPLVVAGADGNWVGCKSGCARWAQLAADGSAVNQTAADLLWRSRDAQAEAGSSCAQPGGSPFDDEAQTAGYAGSWCFCAHTGLASPVASYCGSPTARNVPEQINLLLTGASTATVAFVTFGGRECCLPPPPAPLSRSMVWLQAAGALRQRRLTSNICHEVLTITLNTSFLL